MRISSSVSQSNPVARSGANDALNESACNSTKRRSFSKLVRQTDRQTSVIACSELASGDSVKVSGRLHVAITGFCRGPERLPRLLGRSTLLVNQRRAALDRLRKWSGVDLTRFSGLFGGFDHEIISH